MGCGGSKNKGQVINKSSAAPQLPPYDGPQVEYSFVNTEVSTSIEMFAFSEGNEMQTSDVDSFYPALSAKMAEGYHMVVYRTIPGQAQMQGFSTTTKMPYQGIFMRRQDEGNQPFKLVIEKSSFQVHTIKGGIIPFGEMKASSDSGHLIASIVKHTQNGGRFVCFGLSGQATSAGLGNMLSGKSPVIGVDLFFEIPNQPTENYVYQTISVPLRMTMKMGLGGVTSSVNFDWLGNFNGPLSQGWKLVQIYMDSSYSMNMQSLSTSNMNLNTIWFFEKPLDVVHDPTPRYEGTMVEFHYDIKAGFSSTKSTIKWEPKIIEMGRNGWELACIMDSPGVTSAGLGGASMKLMMFFQRRLNR